MADALLANHRGLAELKASNKAAAAARMKEAAAAKAAEEKEARRLAYLRWMEEEKADRVTERLNVRRDLRREIRRRAYMCICARVHLRVNLRLILPRQLRRHAARCSCRALPHHRSVEGTRAARSTLGPSTHHLLCLRLCARGGWTGRRWTWSGRSGLRRRPRRARRRRSRLRSGRRRRRRAARRGRRKRRSEACDARVRPTEQTPRHEDSPLSWHFRNARSPGRFLKKDEISVYKSF